MWRTIHSSEGDFPWSSFAPRWAGVAASRHLGYEFDLGKLDATGAERLLRRVTE